MSDLDTLAETLDQWVVSSEVSVTETEERLIANQLDGAQALRLVELIDLVGWTDFEISDRGGDMQRHLLTAAATRVRVEVSKPAAPAGVETVVTNTAFAAALGRDQIASQVWVLRLSQPFSTVAVRFTPWGDVAIDPAVVQLPESRKVVRLLAPVAGAKRDLGRWILRDADLAMPTENGAFKLWRDLAACAAAMAIANELEPEGELLFRGPPVSRFKLTDADKITDAAFAHLQRAAGWAYDSPRELENRQGLLAAEVARSALRDGNLPALCEVCGPALDGARIAYGFGVTQQSKDTLKALSDLRKAVMDETSKLAESTRALATAVSGAVFGNIGLIVARLTLAPSNKFVPVAALCIGLVLAAYVGAVIASGVHFLRLQRTLREEWRDRLYRFLIDSEYEKLVTEPVARAEKGFYIAAWTGGVMSVVLLIAVGVIVLTPLPPATPAPPTVSTPTEPQVGRDRPKPEANRAVPGKNQKSSEVKAPAPTPALPST